ncbi:MAG: ABC transporter ATP-binding protein [Alphaproteobacteria bacterium]|nr:ABC transporter ATP-binding protein [Alphaproteobacteria bacterium]
MASSTSAPPTLQVRDLTIRYRTPTGTITALDSISLAIPKGGALGLVGESGSGKSTVGLALMGLLPSEAQVAGGQLLLDGSDLLALDPEARRRMRGPKLALVFQDPFTALNPSLRVGAQIGEGLVHHRGISVSAGLDAARRLLAEVGISDPAAVADAYPHQLSGGMRQRALIASALACEPELLILDEPTTALDVTIEAQILDLLEGLRAKRGLSLLFISHNLGVVRRVCDRIAVIYAARVVEQGPTAAVFARPAHPYTKGLLAAIPRLSERRGRLAAIPGRLPDLAAPPPGCIFAARCPFAEPACIAERMPMREDGERAARCRRLDAVGAAPWPVAAPAPHAARAEAGAPIVSARGLAKTFHLRRGLAALRWQGGRIVHRPVFVRALDGVDLDVAPGEVLGLVGESGCGKTTLGRTLLRLVEPSAGTIRIDGRDVTGLDARAMLPVRRMAQIVFQNPDSSLNPRKTVRELIGRPLVRFGLAAPGDVAARVAALLDLVQLPASYAERYAHQMSGGEKQRVGIARAIATEPKFLVCDEPVSALDVSVQASIVNLLADLRDRLAVAYVFISHDISVVAHLADRIAVMYRGRIVETGPTAAVLAPPYHPYTAALLSAVPDVDAPKRDRIRLKGEIAAPTGSQGCVFESRCPRRIGDVCATAMPPTRAPAPGHAIACHLETEELGH